MLNSPLMLWPLTNILTSLQEAPLLFVISKRVMVSFVGCERTIVGARLQGDEQWTPEQALKGDTEAD